MTKYYKSKRPIGGKATWVIVDNIGKIVNRDPDKKELNCLEMEKQKGVYRSVYYNDTNTCAMIKKDGTSCGRFLAYGRAYREHDKNGDLTGKWICRRCYNIGQYIRGGLHDVSNCRTGNQNPNSLRAKGDLIQKLANISKNLICLNKKYDNYQYPIDSICPITQLRYQIKGKWYDSTNMCWAIGFKNIRNSIKRGFRFYKLILYCVSKDGKKIERLYEMPEEEVEIRDGITIWHNPTNPHRKHKIPWYEKYRIKDDEELDRVNKIWKDIIENVNTYLNL